MIRHDKMNEATDVADTGGASTGAASAGAVADAGVIANAAEAVAQAKAAIEAQRTQSAAEKAALEARLAALEMKPAPAAVAPETLEEVKRFMTRERNDRRLDTVKRMGLNVPLSDAQILALAPDVDPREPDGIAKIEQWRVANKVMFTQQGQTQQSVVEALKTDLEELGKKTSLFSASKLTASIFGGGS